MRRPEQPRAGVAAGLTLAQLEALEEIVLRRRVSARADVLRRWLCEPLFACVLGRLEKARHGNPLGQPGPPLG